MMGRVLPILLIVGAISCTWESGERRWIARVDDSRIPFAELQRLIDARLEANPQLRREDVLAEELQRLISEQLMLNRATELGVKIHDGEVERRLRAIHGEDFSVANPAYLEEVRRQMTLERTALLDLGDRLGLPESTLMLYFEEHRDSYGRPAQVQIRQIVVEDEATAQQLRTALADEGRAARGLRSDVPLAPRGGLRGDRVAVRLSHL